MIIIWIILLIILLFLLLTILYRKKHSSDIECQDEQQQQQQQPEKEEQKRLKWLTVATKSHDNLTKLQDQAETQKINLKVLGMRDDRFQRWGQNFGVKLQLYHHYLKYNKIDRSDIVLMTDAFDVVMVGSHDEIIQKFLMLQSDIVISAEVNCHPDIGLMEAQLNLYPEYKGMYRFLNSGTIIGRAGAILDVFEQNPYDIDIDDQYYWTTRLLERKAFGCWDRNHIVLDVNNTIFMCMAFALDDFVFDENYTRPRCISTNSYPSIFHFNGTGGSLPNFYKMLDASQQQK